MFDALYSGKFNKRKIIRVDAKGRGGKRMNALTELTLLTLNLLFLVLFISLDSKVSDFALVLASSLCGLDLLCSTVVCPISISTADGGHCFCKLLNLHFIIVFTFFCFKRTLSSMLAVIHNRNNFLF